MTKACRCGCQASYELGCVQCSSPCCLECSVQMESATYCTACALAITGTDIHSPKTLLV